MLNFFEYIIYFFELVCSMIVNFTTNMVLAIGIVQQSVVSVGQIVGLFPGLIGISIGLVLSVGVIKLLLGWGNV